MSGLFDPEVAKISQKRKEKIAEGKKHRIANDLVYVRVALPNATVFKLKTLCTLEGKKMEDLLQVAITDYYQPEFAKLDAIISGK